MLRPKEHRGLLVTVIVQALLAATISAQGQGAGHQATFDIASIRLAKPGQLGGTIKPYPGGHGYLAQNIPVKLMISLMYRVPMRQISGGPAWIETERFDVQAKADRPYGRDELQEMYRNMLAERFGLRLHKETREGPVYALSVDPSGLKMKVDASDQDYEIPVNGPPQHVIGRRVPMPYFCWWLSQVLQKDERPVLDRSGLDGNYDWTLSFMPVLPPDVSAEALSPEMRDLPSIFVALREQLGLRLEAEKGPVDYYVVDHLEKPSEN